MPRTPEIKAACRHRLRLIQDIEGFMQRDPQMSRRPSPGKAGERSTFGPPARGSLLVLLLSRSIHISASLVPVPAMFLKTALVLVMVVVLSLAGGDSIIGL